MAKHKPTPRKAKPGPRPPATSDRELLGMYRAVEGWRTEFTDRRIDDAARDVIARSIPEPEANP